MPKYINADELIKGRVSNDPVRIAVECMPAVDVSETVYGHWKVDNTTTLWCSECRKEGGVEEEGRPDYCPNCGACMLPKLNPKRKVIAIDFDGCLCTNAWPKVGEPCWDIIKKAQHERENGAALILWTCREGNLLSAAIGACAGWGLRFDAVNESLPEWIELFGSDPRKIGATEYWDDKAVKVIAGGDS